MNKVTSLFFVLAFLPFHKSAVCHTTVTVTPELTGRPQQQLTNTLVDYLTNTYESGVFNQSNTTVIFLPGTHEVKGVPVKQLVVDHVSNVQWIGAVVSGERAVIQCMQEFGLVFMNVQNLTLANIELINCGFHKTVISDFLTDDFYSLSKLDRTGIHASLAILNTLSVHLVNIKIKRGRGYGLQAIDLLGNTLIEFCIFENNHIAETVQNTAGGNILVILIYLPWRYTLKTTNNISHFVLNNSVIQKGGHNYLYDQSFPCGYNTFEYAQYKKKPILANGLGIVIYRIYEDNSVVSTEFLINNVTFSMNIGRSVLIERNDEPTKIIITNSRFLNDGTLMILSTGSGALMQIKDSIFRDGPTRAIYMCIPHEGIQKILNYNFSPTLIKVENCNFTNFGFNNRTNDAAVVQIHQVAKSRECIIEIINSKHKSNRMTAFYLEFITGGSDLAEEFHTVSITNCTFENNHSPNGVMIMIDGRNEGISHYVNVSHATFIENTLNSYNSNKGIVYAYSLTVLFTHCCFENSIGTALQTNQSSISFFGDNQFINNTGTKGGAISLLMSIITLNNNSALIIRDNNADYGGAVFAEPIIHETGSDVMEECSIHFSTDYDLGQNISISLINNSAVYFGNELFNGAYENCYTSIHDSSQKSQFVNRSLLNMIKLFPKSLRLHSLPTSLQTCTNGTVLNTIQAFPGAAFNVSIKAIPKISGTFLHTPVIVEGRLCAQPTSKGRSCNYDYQNELRSGVEKQIVTEKCRNVTFGVYSEQKKVYVEISIDKSEQETPLVRDYLTRSYIHTMIEVQLLPCPIGYRLANTMAVTGKQHCECIQYISSFGLQCDINHRGTFLVPSPFWIGFHPLHPDNVTIHTSCPFDYCRPSTKHVSLSKPDEQCNHNHGGVLCGGCQANLSLVLGSSNCKKCSNVYLFLIIPFTLAGVALVVLLLKCNFTVSTGHINGIIFYANIVHINKALFFQNQGTAYTISSTFIAWLNLDLGIETCFFESMDSYAKTWLQFAFPVYLWGMVGIIVILAHYSSRAGKLLGSNSVPVLATLFLLSYAKLLRTIIGVISFTFVEFEDGSFTTVWLLDGNVEFFSLKHVALLFMAIFFSIVYILPLTILVTFAPCFQKVSHHKGFRWVNKIKPLLDAYQGPYNRKFRCWTGLLLLLRIVLFVIFSSNYNNDPSLNFFWINILVGPLAMLSLLKTVYRHKFARFLETLSLLNIVILAAITSLTITTGYKNLHKMREYVTYCSIAITFFAFLVALTYHVTQKLITALLLQIIKKSKGTKEDEGLIEQEMKEKSVVAPTTSVVEIEHTLSDSLREPFLDVQ